MAVDYNLVVLGGGPIARYAAAQARQYPVRVALVLPQAENSENYTVRPWDADRGMDLSCLRHFNYSRFVAQHGPYHMGKALFQDGAIAQEIASPRSVDWDWMVRSLQRLVSASEDRYAPSQLEQLGIDVIQGSGQFVTDPHLGFRVEGTTAVSPRPSPRLLRSQSYLIAMEGQAVVPAIPGIESISFQTLATFFRPDTFAIQPQSVLIISDQLEGLEVATTLAHLGTQVTLVMTTPQLLPLADPAVNQWLQIGLEASGVRVYLDATIYHVGPQDQGCVAEFEWGQDAVDGGSDRANSPSPAPPSGPTQVVADELLLVMGRQVDFTTLNLGAIAVHYTAQGIPVDSRYRSSNPRVFAIGDAVHHTVSPAQMNHYQAEVAIALRHALLRGPLLNGLKMGLSLPPLVDPQALPTMVNTHPPAAWMGWSEPDASVQYGDRLTVLYQSFQHLPQAQRLSAYIPQATAGFCKLLVLDDGQIVGVHIVGIQAEEFVNVVAIAMHHSLPITDLTPLYPPTPSFTADVLRGLVSQWERDRLQRRPRLTDWLELAFNWQRDWTRR
ncbi:MAG: FAD-dependent oxidoreductase [Leptolyngbyaceae cyanobacterium]